MIDIKNWPLLDKEELFNYLRFNSYRSERYKLLYVATPKVACTSLKWWFAALEGHSQVLRGITDSPEPDPYLIIHDAFPKVAPNVTGLMPEVLSEVLSSDSYFRFAVVRNPYKRIFSAWQSKLLLQVPLQTGPYLQCDFYHLPIKCPSDIAAAFEGFLEHLVTNESPSYWDVHWTPQATLLRPDLINYSKLVKIEDTKEFSQTLSERLGGHIPDPFANRRTNESLIPYLPEFVTERSSELISSLYVEDFETFEYSKHPPEARETFSTDQFNLAFKAIALIRERHQRLGERNAQIVSLNQTVTERDEQIVSLNQAVTESEEQIHAYRLQAEQYDIQLLAANTQIDNLNQTISERDGQIDAYRLQVEQFDVQLLAANTQIDNLNQNISERDSQIDAYRLQAEQFDIQLGAATKQIDNLNQSISERDGQIDAYRLQQEQCDVPLRAATTQIVNFNQAVRQRDEHIDNLIQTLTDRDNEIAALRSSTCWRITKPLRNVSRLLNRSRKGANQRLTLEIDRLPEGFDRDVHPKLIPNVAEAGVDPSTHYLSHGHQEGCVFSQPLLDMLPESFDPDVYLKLNPDLAEAAVDPSTHYLNHGRYEGRFFSVPALDICGEHEFKPDRKTILVVSHEASRTGAPILSVNLVQALVESYNVVTLLLGGGPLSDAFRLSGAAVITLASLRANPSLANLLIGQLCKRFNFKFAFVNSIESRVVLPALGNYFVPAISLVHEFASYTRPRTAFRDALFWSGEVVFSANVTMENAFVEYPDLVDRSVHILPQGRCLLPLAEFSEEQRQAESMHIRRLMRPKGLAEDTVIVLGAGSVQLRKGVDLFIECAARVHCAPGGERCRFVWIGNGYDPDNDVGYSVYLADQIRRAGLQKHVFFIAETTAIETAYEEADLLLLSSRLDPLPNVAIDAMAHGVPVLCFNKTTGIADFLIESGLGNHCVAEYIDSTNMAEKILALASSQVLREHVGEQCRVASIAYFNMKKYVARLEVLAQGVCDRTQQEKADTKTILDSGLFRRDFSCPPYQQSQSIEDEVRFYVRAWASGISRRKPFPGFHPGIYQEQHGLATQGADPFADYLRAGSPEGPWNYPVIVAQEADGDELPDNHRVALHLHIYYPELLPEIITRLACNRICPDLYVSITDENARQWVISQLSEYKGKVVDIQLVPNRGRDIGPFLTAFEPEDIGQLRFCRAYPHKKDCRCKGCFDG